jgi:hypothetical protein
LCGSAQAIKAAIPNAYRLAGPVLTASRQPHQSWRASRQQVQNAQY